jgi:RimJ/RimL family protein N-acetyltransferase
VHASRRARHEHSAPRPPSGARPRSIGCFVLDGHTEITYWIDRSAWGQGIAGRALALLLETVEVRPIRARTASDNRGSLRVLQKAGFSIIGTEIAYASARGAEIEETVLRLD